MRNRIRALVAQFSTLLLLTWLASPCLGAQTESVLYTFRGLEDGGVPYAGLVMDKAGNLYGTTSQYGNPACTFPDAGCGTVFELIPAKQQSSLPWVYKVIYTFQGGEDGNDPSSTLVFDEAGNLYGTTVFGGTGCGGTGCGTVFELQRDGNGWKESVLYRFTGEADGEDPLGALALDKVGNLYGSTAYGGDANCYYIGTGCGVVFQLKRPEKEGEGWTEKVLHTFTGGDGADPFVGVTLDAAGNIYGVTALGGQGQGGSSGGVVFSLRGALGTSAWIESTLYEFPELQGNPAGPLILDKDGNLYGVTEVGGEYGVGSVFELKRPMLGNSAWTETDLYSFPGPPDGWFPLYSGVVFDQTGKLYGTTMEGGASANCQTHCGTIFQLTNSGNFWEETGLFSFMGGAEGFYPFNGVILDSKGNVYGMTPNGGDPNCTAFTQPGCGVIFRISRF